MWLAVKIRRFRRRKPFLSPGVSRRGQNGGFGFVLMLIFRGGGRQRSGTARARRGGLSHN